MHRRLKGKMGKIFTILHRFTHKDALQLICLRRPGTYANLAISKTRLSHVINRIDMPIFSLYTFPLLLYTKIACITMIRINEQ